MRICTSVTFPGDKSRDTQNHAFQSRQGIGTEVEVEGVMGGWTPEGEMLNKVEIREAGE